MTSLLTIVITCTILGLQFHFGRRKSKLLGAIIPTLMTALFIAMSLLDRTTEYIMTGSACVACILAAWGIGYSKAAQCEKAELDKMKAKDLE